MLWGRAVLLLLVGVSCAWAQTAQVTSVRFNTKRLSGVPNEWVEAVVTLRPALASQLPENLTVNLLVNYKTPRGQYPFKGSCELYILERTAQVRFYIPGDLVKAYSLSGTPSEYLVELSSVATGAQEYASLMGSPSMVNPAHREDLKASTLATSLTLLPHYNTPFYALAENWRDLPSYVVP